MLRVIGGTARGRLLKVPRGSKIRPTSDKVRESLFNIIGPEFVNKARFMDLFAGCGAVGIEALSRGAEYVTFIESNPVHIKIIRENLKLCGFHRSAEVIHGEVFSTLDRLSSIHNPPYDIVFADPPYDYSKWKILLPKIVSSVIISDYGLLVVEHSSKVSMPEEIDNALLYGNYRYGDTTLTVYKKVKR